MSDTPPQPQIAEMIKRGLASLAAKQNDAALEEAPKEDLNQLPFPLKQEVMTNYIQWIWEPIGMGYQIIGRLFFVDRRYEVELKIPGENTSPSLILEPEFSKAIGQALISAANWKNIWKEHAGRFLEKELFSYGTEGS